MPKKIMSNNRGVALLVTLTVITVLIAATIEMNRRMRSTVSAAAVSRNRITLLQMAAAGIHAGQAILIKDKYDSDADSLQEDWADPDKIREFLQAFQFEKGSVTLFIEDELSKIQVNGLVRFPEGREFNESQRSLWERFLGLLVSQSDALEDVDPSMVISSIKDWLDSGDDDAITGLNGAESDYYAELDPPYRAQNAPFKHLDELKLVNGVTERLFYGAVEAPGISKFTTVHGMKRDDNAVEFKGRININTAEIAVLAALLPVGSEDLAEAIYEYRQEKSEGEYIHDLSKQTWYQNVPGVGDVKIDSSLITTSSDIFRIESTASLHKMKQTVTAVVEREKDQKTGKWLCRVLRWDSE